MIIFTLQTPKGWSFPYCTFMDISAPWFPHYFLLSAMHSMSSSKLSSWQFQLANCPIFFRPCLSSHVPSVTLSILGPQSSFRSLISFTPPALISLVSSMIAPSMLCFFSTSFWFKYIWSFLVLFNYFCSYIPLHSHQQPLARGQLRGNVLKARVVKCITFFRYRSRRKHWGNLCFHSIIFNVD